MHFHIIHHRLAPLPVRSVVYILFTQLYNLIHHVYSLADLSLNTLVLNLARFNEFNSTNVASNKFKFLTLYPQQIHSPLISNADGTEQVRLVLHLYSNRNLNILLRFDGIAESSWRDLASGFHRSCHQVLSPSLRLTNESLFNTSDVQSENPSSKINAILY